MASTDPRSGPEQYDDLIGSSPAWLSVRALLRCAADSDAPLLIEGETGSGKELAARAAHYWGIRSSRPFVAVNCGAVPDQLLEAELYGYERGAFTDAKVARRGLVAEADNGTLFLDEVNSLSARAQVTLLRFLQDQRYRPLGSSRELRTNVRVIAAANEPLEGATRHGCFRADLMYRLKILHIELPPLRARAGDAEQLAQYFANLYCARYRMPVTRLDASALAWIRSYSWPGNVRELENWVHRELVMGRSSGLASASRNLQDRPHSSSLSIVSFQQAKAEAVRIFERDYVLTVLRQANGNVTRAAFIAGKERRAFGKLLKKHGIDRQTMVD